MCGVVGYRAASLTSEGIAIVLAALYESKIRGLHAAGFALRRGRATGLLLKRYLRVEDATGALEDALYQARGDSISLVAHTRYSTSGDWLEPKNNQPIVVDGVALAFNGVLDMGTKCEMEDRWHVHLEAENDGELLLRLMKRGLDPVAWLKRSAPYISFAGALLTPDGSVEVLRNERRPLWYVRLDPAVGGGVLVASTQSILNRALGGAGATGGVELPAFQVWEVMDLANKAVPEAQRSQCAGRLFGLPLRYAGNRRYGPRVPNAALPGRPL